MWSERHAGILFVGRSHAAEFIQRFSKQVEQLFQLSSGCDDQPRCRLPVLRQAGGFRPVGIATHASLANLHLEHAEVADFHFAGIGKCFGDIVQGFLDDIEHLALVQPGFLTDPK
jgi:hypothetical protein